MLRWEKGVLNVPNCDGLWACSLNGKTINSFNEFKSGKWYNPDFYWCRISDIPEILPPTKPLKPIMYGDLINYMQKGEDVTIKNKETNTTITTKITSIELFKDGSYLLCTNNGNFTKTFNDFYGAQ